MAVIVCIIGSTGEGKTTSTIINPDGKCFYLPPTEKAHADKYEGMDPKTHVIINLDEKPLPLPSDLWCPENENYLETSDFDTIREFLQYISTQEQIKSVSLDTLNLYLSKKEYNDRKKLNFDLSYLAA